MKTKYQLIKPLIYPPGYEDETPIAYLIRVAELNAYKSYTWLFESENVPSYVLSHHNYYKLLADTEWSGFKLDAKIVSEVSTVHVNNMNCTKLKFCPLCIKGYGYYKIQWQYKLSVACIEHGIWLHDRCEFCESNAGLTNHKIDQCICGRKISETKSEYCSDDILNMQRFLEGRFESIADGICLLENAPSLELIRRIEFLRFFLRWIKKEHWKEIDTKNILLDQECARDFMSDVSEALFSGEAGFMSFLKYVYSQGYVGSNRYADLFTRFHQSFYKTFPEDKFKPYKRLIERYLNLYWHKPLTKRNKNFDKKTVDEHPWVPLQQACREYDLHKSRLRQAIQQNLVRSKPLVKDRRVITMVFKPDLVARVNRLRSLVTAKEAATILGLTKLQFSRLRETGCFEVMVQPGTHGNATWQFSRDEIFRYRDLFLTGLPEISGEYWNLPQLLQFFGSQIDDPLVTILKAIEGKELKVSAKLNDTSGLSSMLFVKNDFLEWYERHKAKSSLVSIPATAKLLGLQQQFTYQLVEAGLIETSLKPSCSLRWISKQNINDFHNQYVLLSKLAKRVQISSRTLLSYLASRDIYPVDQDWADPLRQKVYERERLANIQLLAGYV